MKPKILITRLIPKSGLDFFQDDFELDINTNDAVMEKQEIIDRIQDKQALLPLLTDRIDAEIMDAAPELKIIANYAVGYNNIDVAAATERGILVTNTPGVLTDTTADFAFSLLVSIARRIPEADRFTRRGDFKGWAPMLLLGQDIHSKTLGIIGCGRIGQALAKRARGFDMRVLYYDACRPPVEVENELGIEYRAMDEVLVESDFISLHVPLLDSTRHLIGARELGIMKKSACLINTSRGPVIDEKALIKALQEKQIFGAALDVYEQEPLVPEELRKLDNVVLTPHTASASEETRGRMSEIAAQNIINALSGQMPVSLVNKDVLASSRIKIKA